MNPLRVGVVGVGSLGEHHARILSQLPEAELAGVFDVNPRRAQEIAHKFKTRVFESLEQLADETVAATVVVPTDRHRVVAGYLLERDRHLLIEKPIASTTQEAEELSRIAETRNLILQVGHVERFNPVLSVLDARPTRPHFIEAHRLAPYPAPRDGLPPRGTEVSVILDLMIHDLEVILHLVRSRVKTISAVGVPVLSPTEDIANVRLAFENGCIANVTASRISPERMRKIRVFYEDAYVSLDYMNQSGEIYGRGERGIERNKLPIQRGEPLVNELRAFVECVRDHAQPRVSGREASEALRLAVAIHQRLREGPS
jgi:predicted dehydrogenase